MKLLEVCWWYIKYMLGVLRGGWGVGGGEKRERGKDRERERVAVAMEKKLISNLQRKIYFIYF